mmetsp:Transcript_5049/g.12401  ORF Transcript_5049/g.12401 Transcript_5049/m.12401 type:complete len:269 (-) Transcript_5049:209-1015(-)
MSVCLYVCMMHVVVWGLLMYSASPIPPSFRSTSFPIRNYDNYTFLNSITLLERRDSLAGQVLELGPGHSHGGNRWRHVRCCCCCCCSCSCSSIGTISIAVAVGSIIAIANLTAIETRPTRTGFGFLLHQYQVQQDARHGPPVPRRELGVFPRVVKGPHEIVQTLLGPPTGLGRVGELLQAMAEVEPDHGHHAGAPRGPDVTAVDHRGPLRINVCAATSVVVVVGIVVGVVIGARCGCRFGRGLGLFPQGLDPFHRVVRHPVGERCPQQ